MAIFSRKPRIGEFEAAALPHLNDIYRTSRHLLGNPTAAEDVVQDVYLAAWKSFDRFEPGTNCRAWLFRILFHSLHHYRRKWLNSREISDAEEIIGKAQARPAEPQPEIRDEDMLAALGAIAGEYREVVLLVDVEEFSYKDAAAILAVPPGTVMSRLSRGRRLLRERLSGVAQSYGIGRQTREGISA
jgi:RNA polymerase sigma-70 factor, ECF subfamily